MRRLARSAVIVVALLGGGCASIIAPTYDQTADQKATSAYERIERVLARVELGEYAQADSYKTASDEYVNTIAELSVALMRVETLRVSSRGTGEQARETLARLVAGCSEQVETLAALHRTSGLQARSGVAQPVRVSCDQAVRAVRAMK